MSYNIKGNQRTMNNFKRIPHKEGIKIVSELHKKLNADLYKSLPTIAAVPEDSIYITPAIVVSIIRMTEQENKPTNAIEVKKIYLAKHF